MTYGEELKTAQDLARQAGEVILRIYATDFSVQMKGKGDPVTEADRLANELIVSGLSKAFPEDIIIAEESAKTNEKGPLKRVWYVDPLDGTNEFISKNGEFSVMIGLAIDGGSTLGVVYRPEKDIMYCGISEREAWVHEKGNRTPLGFPNKEELSANRLAVSRSHRHKRMEEIMKSVGISGEIPCGSVGLKVALIAQGKADLYIEPGPYTSLWDACAPEAVMKGSGGDFTDLFGNPIRYDYQTIKNKRGLVASNGKDHRKIIDALKPIAKDLYPE